MNLTGLEKWLTLVLGLLAIFTVMSHGVKYILLLDSSVKTLTLSVNHLTDRMDAYESPKGRHAR